MPVVDEKDAALRAKVIEAGRSAKTMAEVARALGAAFVLHRRVVSKQTKAAKLDNVEHATVDEAVTAVLKLYAPNWVATLTPALVAGYTLGLKEIGDDSLDPVWIEQTARVYAESLGEHINEVSKQALLEGLQAQINRKVPARAALERVIDAYGVTPRTMKTLVNVWTKAPDPKATVLTSRQVKNPISNRIDTLIAKALSERATAIGSTESYSAKNQAKQLAWLWALQSGQLPSTVQKRWVTAEDERVCPQCAPLDGKAVSLDDQFKVPGGGHVWTPALHPNCRCDIVLENAADRVRNTVLELTVLGDREMVGKSAFGVVHKARGDDPFDRDRSGRFASQESRPARQFREPTREESEQAQRVADLLRNVAPEQEKVDLAERVDLTGPGLGEKVDLGRGVDLGGKVNLLNVDLTRPRENVDVSGGRASLGQTGLGQARLTSDAIRLDLAQAKIPMININEDDEVETSDQWVASGPPVFGIFGPQMYRAPYDEADENIMLSDLNTPFYRHYEAGYKSQVSPLREALAGYWDNFISEQGTDYFTDGGYEYDTETNSVQLDWNDRRVRVPYDAYVDALVQTLHGRSVLASDEVEIFEVRRYANDDQYDDDYLPPQDSDAGPGERGLLVSTYDLANVFNLNQMIEEYVPDIGIARHLNADHYDDDSTRHNMTNPGKWRILYPSIEYNGAADNEYLPANYYVIEPETLFDNSIPETDYP